MYACVYVCESKETCGTQAKMSHPTGYGTTGRNPAAATTNHVRDLVDEERPLLNGDVASTTSSPKSLVGRLRKAARAEIKRDWADVVLIFCYIITGLLDSASISIWGSFVSMQTGEFFFIVVVFVVIVTPSHITRKRKGEKRICILD